MSHPGGMVEQYELGGGTDGGQREGVGAYRSWTAATACEVWFAEAACAHRIAPSVLDARIDGVI